MKKSKSYTIFLPGFYGSFLKGSQGRIWLDLNNAIFNKNHLALRGFGLKNEQDYSPDGVFKNISIIPGLYKKNVYGKFVDSLNKNLHNSSELLEFSYDWRQCIDESARSLYNYLEQLESPKGIQLIGHSMGGLVITRMLQIYAESPLLQLIKKLVIAATPFKGTVAIFKDMFTGIQFGLNKSLLTPEAFSTFPASYQLMDPDGLFIDNLNTQHSLFKYELWESHQWALLNPNHNYRAEISLRAQKLKAYLDQGRIFFENLHDKKSINSLEHIQVLHIVGSQQPTVKNIFWCPKNKSLTYLPGQLKKKFGKDKVAHFIQDGDELVTLDSAQLPPFYDNLPDKKQITTQWIHSELLDDPKVRSTIKNFIH